MKIENVAAYQGSYSSGTTYYEGDIVTYNAVNYLSLIDSNTGNQPDTNLSDWVVLGIQSVPSARYATGTSASLSLSAGTYRIDLYTDRSGSFSVGLSGSYTSIAGPLPDASNGAFGTMIISLSSTQTVTLTGAHSFGLLIATPVTT